LLKSYKKLFLLSKTKTHFNKSGSLLYGKILFSTFIASIFLYSCGSSKKDDFDLSNFKVPKKVNGKFLNSENSESLAKKKELIINDFQKYQNKTEVLSAVKFGKKDPFSESETKLTKLDSNFQLMGFLNTNLKSFAFVIYSGKQGTITQESVGGLNTDLLPDGAKVLNIDPENEKLTIEFDNKKFTFELKKFSF